MLHIPILRQGKTYESIDKITIVHHATGEPVATVSQANAGLISRDVHRWDFDVLEQFTVKELIAMCKKAGDLLMNGTLPIGDSKPDARRLHQPIVGHDRPAARYCRQNMAKIESAMLNMEAILDGLTGGLDLDVLDTGYGLRDGHT